MSFIRLLDPQLINQIAAGEVVERPASVIKELIENALDANATVVTVSVRQGGQSFIKVDDNGCGMSKDDLLLSVQRHTTSKLHSGDLSAINTFGFRGEALAAISSVSRLSITSCVPGQDHGWTLTLEGGKETNLVPAAAIQGTSVEIRDLFFSTPARLKFMKSQSTELEQISDIIEKMSFANPSTTFVFHKDSKKKIYHPGLEARLENSFGADFLINSFPIQEEHENYSLKGYLGLPTYNRASADRQFFFVNNRPVKDKIIAYCLKHAFSDLVPPNRYPVGILFFNIPLDDIDVNVHPAKTEIRFRDVRLLREFTLTSLKKSIFSHSQQTARVNMYGRKSSEQGWDAEKSSVTSIGQSFETNDSNYSKAGKMQPSFFIGNGLTKYKTAHENTFDLSFKEDIDWVPSLDLGRALGQINNSYIIACNSQGLVLVDPHAAHERIVYEKMKTYWDTSLGAIQPFLLSCIFQITRQEFKTLNDYGLVLNELGFKHEIIDEKQCRLYAIPDIFKAYDPQLLLSDFCSIVQEGEDMVDFIQRWRNHMMANWACRESIKLGQSLSLIEMNALLREIEKTPNSGQCNHGRPVYRQFSMNSIASLFERS